MLQPTDLLGDWVLRRTVDDRRAGTTGTVDGTATLHAPGPDEVRWDEAGTMTFDGRTVAVSRRLLVRRTAGGTWTVHFSDGRVFHEWDWGTAVEHACAPDVYSGVLDGDTDRWTVQWAARGPAKDYRLSSVLTPVRAD